MKYLIIYLEVEHLLNFLSQEEKGDLLDILIKYAKDELEPKIENKNVLNVFNFLKSKLDSQFAKSRLKSETSKVNGLKGGRPPKKPKKTQSNPKEPNGLFDKDVQEQFQIFWNKYDYKKSRSKSEASFKTALKKESFENIIDGLENYIKNRGTDPKFWKHPTTWLNSESWSDEYKTKKDNHNNFKKQDYNKGTERFNVY